MCYLTFCRYEANVTAPQFDVERINKELYSHIKNKTGFRGKRTFISLEWPNWRMEEARARWFDPTENIFFRIVDMDVKDPAPAGTPDRQPAATEISIPTPSSQLNRKGT